MLVLSTITTTMSPLHAKNVITLVAPVDKAINASLATPLITVCSILSINIVYVELAIMTTV